MEHFQFSQNWEMTKFFFVSKIKWELIKNTNKPQFQRWLRKNKASKWNTLVSIAKKFWAKKFEKNVEYPIKVLSSSDRTSIKTGDLLHCKPNIVIKFNVSNIFWNNFFSSEVDVRFKYVLVERGSRIYCQHWMYPCNRKKITGPKAYVLSRLTMFLITGARDSLPTRLMNAEQKFIRTREITQPRELPADLGGNRRALTDD